MIKVILSKPLLLCLLLFGLTNIVQAQSPKVLVGVVVDYQTGANWDGIVFLSGNLRYSVQLSSSNGDVTKYDTIPKVGDKVRVTYRRLRDKFDGAIVVDAIRVTVIPTKLSRGTPTNKNNSLSSQHYYFSVSRPDCCNFRKQKWQEVANIIKAKGVPAFFADWRSLPDSTPRGDWMVGKIAKRLPVAHVDALVLGPFISKEAALDSLNKLQSILQDDGYGRWFLKKNELDAASWNIGMYDFMGFQTR